MSVYVFFYDTNLGEISDMAKLLKPFVHQWFGFFIAPIVADVRVFYNFNIED